MRITDLLKKEAILLGASVNSKENAIDTLVDLMDKAGNITDKEEYKRGIMAREEMGTTAIGAGIAIPHSKNKAVKQAGLASMTVPAGVDYDSMDGEPSNLFFMIAAPAEGSDVHLEVLSRLSTILMDDQFRADLLSAKDKDEYLRIIDKKEQEKFPEETKQEQKESTSVKQEVVQEEKVVTNQGYRVLAVTACPTGIAHTFMAAEALEQKGKEMGYPLKAETNGSGGAKNVLTKEEIEQCDGIIVAADKQVEMARFEGKPVLQVKVADGIHKPEELIQKIIDGKAPIYHHGTSGVAENTVSEEKESVGRILYKQLMNGVSHMLPFVIGGGILIAIAFLLDTYDPANPSNFGVGTPIAAFFKTVGDQAFGFMLPILAGFIAMSIADRPGLAVGFVGGALAKSGMTLTAAEGVTPGFLGALFAGFVAGYLVLGIRKLCDKVLPQSLEGIKPMLIYPVGGILLIGVIMAIFNPIIAVINTGMANFLESMNGASAILLGAIVAGMMSIDMGGPFNKAAYAFGIASIDIAASDPNLAGIGSTTMAAVMIGGMVPPLAIAISSLIFKNKFTKRERSSWPVNIITGLSFISESAIPYAASDPLRVIPSCIVGSAVAGALSMAFGCGSPAPHGGFWVIGVIHNPLQFALALIVGSVVGAVLLGVLRKPVKEA